jgi:hypothetical protein
MGKDAYRDFVEHPRYGRRPRITGLNPAADYEAGVFLHWHSPNEARIRNTAIAADLSRQTPSTVPVTHYFDLRRQCRSCGRPFLFFADEQKYWHEELGFDLASDCVRCVGCRKARRGLAQDLARYEALCQLSEASEAESLEMVESCLTLVAAGAIGRRPLSRLRAILKRLPPAGDAEASARRESLWTRLRELESDDT